MEESSSSDDSDDDTEMKDVAKFVLGDVIMGNASIHAAFKKKQVKPNDKDSHVVNAFIRLQKEKAKSNFQDLKYVFRPITGARRVWETDEMASIHALALDLQDHDHQAPL